LQVYLYINTFESESMLDQTDRVMASVRNNLSAHVLSNYFRPQLKTTVGQLGCNQCTRAILYRGWSPLSSYHTQWLVPFILRYRQSYQPLKLIV